MSVRFLILAGATLCLALAGCGGSNDASTIPQPTTVTLGYGIKQVQLAWTAVPGATHYKVLKRTAADPAFVQIGADRTTTSAFDEISLHQSFGLAYRADACNALGCAPSEAVNAAANLIPAIGYVKASHPSNASDDAGDVFGSALAVSRDGDTIAVGAYLEDGYPPNPLVLQSGAVYVYVRSGATWVQQAYLKASNPGSGLLPASEGDSFGYSVALSADGSTLAVGAPGEDSSATGVNGDQSSNAALDSGAVYIFVRSGNSWTQQAYVKASNTGGGTVGTSLVGDRFGTAVALSSDGNTLAVGAPWEASAAIGVDGDQSDNTAPYAGAVYLFTRSGTAWTQQAYLKASDAEANNQFGISLALSADGQTLAVGSDLDDGPGVTSTTPPVAVDAGAAYVFVRSGGTWSQQAYLRASNAEASDRFGTSIVLSADGNLLAVGAPREDSSSAGVDGNQADNGATDSGAVYLFTRLSGTWSQSAYLKPSNTGAGLFFGRSVALAADGGMVAVGAAGEASNARGIGGSQIDTSAPASGAVYVFKRMSGGWSQSAFAKASNTDPADVFGHAVALDDDGTTLLVGAPGEASGATGIGGDQSDNAYRTAGAAYLY